MSSVSTSSFETKKTNLAGSSWRSSVRDRKTTHQKKLRTFAAPASTKMSRTAVTSARSYLAMRSRYSRCSKLDIAESRGTSMGWPRSTKALQSTSHARFPLIVEGSPSADGFIKLKSSFPTLSACLEKKRCRTMVSVSSYVTPFHSYESLSSSFDDGLYL